MNKKLKTLAMFERIPIDGGIIRKMPNGYVLTEFLPDDKVTSVFVEDEKWAKLRTKELLTDKDILDLVGRGQYWLDAARKNGLKSFDNRTPRQELLRYISINTI